MRLRPLEERDVPDLARMIADPRVARWWPASDARAIASQENMFGIEEAGALVGAIQFWENDDPEYRHAGIDLFVAGDHQRRGIGSAAIREMIAMLWARGHHRIVIDPAVENAAARRAYEKIGFRVVGVMEKYERGRDGVSMELVRREHPRSPARSIEAREATGADVPKILEWMARFNAHEHIDFDPRIAEPIVRELLVRPELGKLIVFEPPGYALITYGFDAEFGGRDAFLTELWLEPASRGAGKSALARVLAVAKENGVRALHLQVRHDNPAAIALYRGAGFETSLRMFMTKRIT